MKCRCVFIRGSEGFLFYSLASLYLARVGWGCVYVCAQTTLCTLCRTVWGRSEVSFGCQFSTFTAWVPGLTSAYG